MSTSNINQNIIPAKETEVSGFISEGLTTKEIASKLFGSTRTIETRRASILKKIIQYFNIRIYKLRSRICLVEW